MVIFLKWVIIDPSMQILCSSFGKKWEPQNKVDFFKWVTFFQRAWTGWAYMPKSFSQFPIDVLKQEVNKNVANCQITWSTSFHFRSIICNQQHELGQSENTNIKHKLSKHMFNRPRCINTLRIYVCNGATKLGNFKVSNGSVKYNQIAQRRTKD